jgi:hypothetical protein
MLQELVQSQQCQLLERTRLDWRQLIRMNLKRSHQRHSPPRIQKLAGRTEIAFPPNQLLK